MIIIFGERTYGKVDRVPGVCYVITIFAHLNFLPLFPQRSFVVLEGTESGGEFRGKEIPVSMKSVFAGYARAWFGVIAVIAGLIAAFGLNEAAAELRLGPATTFGLWAAGIGGLVALFVGGKVGAAVQIGVHVISAVLWYAFTEAAGQNPRAVRSIEGPLVALAVANLTLLVYGLTRFFDRAGPERARELLQQLGAEVPPEDGDEPDEKQEKKWEDWDESEDRRKRRG